MEAWKEGCWLIRRALRLLLYQSSSPSCGVGSTVLRVFLMKFEKMMHASERLEQL